jgi:hypothetical protein
MLHLVAENLCGRDRIQIVPRNNGEKAKAPDHSFTAPCVSRRQEPKTPLLAIYITDKPALSVTHDTEPCAPRHGIAAGTRTLERLSLKISDDARLCNFQRAVGRIQRGRDAERKRELVVGVAYGQAR